MFNLFNKAVPETAAAPAPRPLPAGLIENGGPVVSADADLIELACDGWALKQQIEALQKQLKTITDQLQNSLGAGAALAVDFTSLLVWRFLQGVGSGVYLTASLAAMADISPPNRRAMNMALYQSSLQLGASFGPAVGGFAAHYFGFASVFWFYAGVALLASVTCA